jgi:hypothetical protein
MLRRNARAWPVLTQGFKPGRLEAHYAKHADEFPNLKSAADYQTAADEFIGPPTVTGAFDCVRRSNRHKIRFRSSTNEFAVMDEKRFILTYYRPSPKEHGLSDNMAYFLAECRK